jgi:DNA-nicking Smr family endonuclease
MDEFDEWFNSFNDSSKKDSEELWLNFKKDVEKLNNRLKATTIEKRSLHNFKPSNISPKLPNINSEIQPFDYKVKRKITREKVSVEATLDLHGLTIEQAEKTVEAFIIGCYKQSKTYILIITGKGELSHTKATLRTEFPRFLANPKIAPVVISFTQAGRKHGFQGAYYVLLRKRAQV